MGAEEQLWHPRPRLDADDRIWLIPAPLAKWLFAGLFSGPLVAQVLVFTGRAHPAGVWGDWRVWVVWILGLTLGLIGGLYRPGGRHVGQWAASWLDYHLRPKRATRRRLGRDGGLWDWRHEPWPPHTHYFRYQHHDHPAEPLTQRKMRMRVVRDWWV